MVSTEEKTDTGGIMKYLLLIAASAVGGYALAALLRRKR